MRERRYRFPDSDAAQYVIWITLLIVVCALTLFANLEGRDLWGADESPHAERAREMMASRLAVVEGVDPALVFYLDLPQSTTARLSVTRIREALLAGWRVLARTTDLPPALRSRDDIAVRARVHLQQSEYLLLERLDRRSSS